MTGPAHMAEGGADGQERHVPVLLAEVVAALGPAPGQRIVDGTFGAGGYTRALLDAGANVVAIDRDPDAIAEGQGLLREAGGRLKLVPGRFSQLDELVGEPVDGVVLDIGVSSMHLDRAERGFSFRQDGPLDMRMSRQGPSAADVVNTYRPQDLTRIIGLLGEERHAGRISRSIERARTRRPLATTRELAQAVVDAVGHNPRDKIHPATRTFQGLRIYVNDELGELARALSAAERLLGAGGRLAVVTFHSLEDRIVKRFLADRSGKGGGSRHLPEMAVAAATFAQVAKPVAAGEAEVAANPRARSARLRAAVRSDVPPRPFDPDLFALPGLPPLGPSEER